MLVLLAVGSAGVARAADDTAKFYGQWKTSFPYNGQMVTIISVHDENGYTNYFVTPSGFTPAGSGGFHAANGFWSAAAAAPNNGGTYLFTGKNAVVCTNSVGQTVTWVRDKTPLPKSDGAAPAGDGDAQPASKPGGKVEVEAPDDPADAEPDPSLPAPTRAAIAAFNRKDYKAAWDNFMIGAEQGDAEAQAGLGSMLFQKINPPATGYYAQAEKWLLLSANQGNAKGMDYLAQFYYRNGTNIAGGINPGVNHARVSPGEQAAADAQFRKARMWFEKSAEKGDGYAMGNLAIMLDAGVGGPADPGRATELRAQVAEMKDKKFVRKATEDPETLAMKARWQSGHFEEAIKQARARAEQGNASAQALLGRAYYEGLGVPEDYREAKRWFDLAVAQNQPDAMFFLGMMYEYGHGLMPDLQKAKDLFERAEALGQPYAAMQAKAMRYKGPAIVAAGPEGLACQTAGGVSVGPECIRGGETIDPFQSWKNESN